MTGQPVDDEIRIRYAAERARHQLTLDSIRADLGEQPSPRSVLAAGRRWCAQITAMADVVAKELRDTP